MPELEDHIDAHLRQTLIDALTCPVCNTLTLLAEPDGAEGAWCGMCGWSRPTTLPDGKPRS